MEENVQSCRVNFDPSLFVSFCTVIIFIIYLRKPIVPFIGDRPSCTGRHATLYPSLAEDNRVASCHCAECQPINVSITRMSQSHSRLLQRCHFSDLLEYCPQFIGPAVNV